MIAWHEENPASEIIDDLKLWASVVDHLDNPIHTAFYRFLLFSGLRRGEARALTWKQIHSDRIHLPITKNWRSFDLSVQNVHSEILKPMRGLSWKSAFPSPRAASDHLEFPQNIPWPPHAHRRTFATVAMEVGVLEEIVGRLLNHTPVWITGQRYTLPSLDALHPHMAVACKELMLRTGIRLETTTSV